MEVVVKNQKALDLKTVINSVQFDWTQVLDLVNLIPAKEKLLDGLRLVNDHSNNFMITLNQVFHKNKDPKVLSSMAKLV
jgi:hypothetical protein